MFPVREMQGPHLGNHLYDPHSILSRRLCIAGAQGVQRGCWNLWGCHWVQMLGNDLQSFAEQQVF